MKAKLTALALAASVGAFSASPALAEQASGQASCAPITEPQVVALFDRWAKAAATGKGSEVAATYFDNAVLLATVQNKPATNTAEITAYFDKLLKKEPSAEINSRTIMLGCNTVVDAGTWTFTLKGDDGKPAKVAARYTFVYENRGGEWKIAHHHSSQMPEKPATQ